MEGHTKLKLTNDEGVSIDIEFPDDVIEVLRTIKPGDDFCTKLTGYSEDALREAFDRVQDREHWKNPIVSFCAERDQNLVRQAIEFFAGSKTEFSFSCIAVADQPELNILAGDRVLSVRAGGYYADTE
jgi:hypothetical protein